jgi:hypothetical protein
VRKRDINPVPHDSSRPFRLWDAVNRGQIRWRYYSDAKRAHMGALISVRWGKVGGTIEVIDARNMRFLGGYTLRVNEITFIRPR